MKCTKCGVENIDGAKFCKACGNHLQAGKKKPGQQDPLPGRFIIKKRFKILKRLGKGGMGEVLLAEDLKLKRHVAIKSILIKGSLGDTTSKIRFLREAQTASRLDHPNICTIYEIYEENNRDYIVMQYIDGVTLEQIVGVQTLGIDKIVDIGIQVCDGMMEAHAADIIHRDIKPGNIIVDKKGVAKILDFGLAKFSSAAFIDSDDKVEANITEKGYVLGTVSYISPEQARGKPLDCRTDIFSFGVLLYEMIEGKNPFKKEEHIETLYNVLNKPVEFDRVIPRELERIVKKAVEKDRDHRYPDFFQLKKDLEAFQDLYKRAKEAKARGETEILQYEEQARLLQEVQKTTDEENLGDLVYRIKQFKASTDRDLPTQKRKIPSPWWSLLAILVLIAGYFLFTMFDTGPGMSSQREKFYLCLHKFENKTGENPLAEMLNYLLVESLNQFDEFKTIDEDTARSITANENKNGKGKINLAAIGKRFNIKYTLTGEIKKVRDSYVIDAYLAPAGKEKKMQRITASGIQKDSFLKTQVDMIADGVYRNFFPKRAKNLEIKRFEKIFGNNWRQFSNFYAGYVFYAKKLEPGKAESYFLKSNQLLISRYYLAHLYHFNGERHEALRLIEAIIPGIEKLTPPLQLQVRAMQARLNFRFMEEIKYLEELKNEFPFSKEVFYELGEAYFHHASPVKAMEYYKQALELDRRYSRALNHLGYCYAYIGDHSSALKAFQEYRGLDESANSFDSLGDGYFYSGQLDYAAEMKKSAVSQSDDPIAYPFQTLVDIYILEARYNEAQDALNNYIKLEKAPQDKAYVLGKQAFIAYSDKNYESALEQVNKSLDAFDSDDIKDNTADAHWLKGLILLALDRVEESRAELRWLEEFKNKYRLDSNNFNPALKHFMHLRAAILDKENQPGKAIQCFNALMEIKHKLSYWSTYYNYQYFHTQYAEFLKNRRQYDEALQELDRCLEFNGDYIPALWVKAEVLEKLNRKDPAKAIYEKIAELYGDSGEKNFHRGLLSKKL
jgi:serine/threonine protein kinase/Flp pilus assembly protein TadD